MTASATAHSNDLVAILLITRSRPGPKLIFHYPARPTIHGKDWPDRGSHTGDTVRRGAQSDDAHEIQLSQERIFGYTEENLEKLLSPGKWCDQKRFEARLGELIFTGRPVFAGVDGDWAGKFPNPKATTRHLDVDVVADEAEGSRVFQIPSKRTKPMSHDFSHISESLDSPRGIGLSTSADSNYTVSGTATEQLLMFHVVFVQQLGNSLRTASPDVIYQSLATTLSKALHYCQNQSGYVANETRSISSIRARARHSNQDAAALWAQIIESSELAWAMSQIYENACMGEVANIRLNGMPISLQIEPSLSISARSSLSPSDALLLLDEKEAILHELAHADSSPLSIFIRGHTPTKSLQKHAINLGMSIHDVLYLAGHLITWRKACMIAPLHQRNYYVASKRSQTGEWIHHNAEYARRFPTLPSLATVIKALGAKPIKYGVLIPSRDHRGPYLEILAFLVRYEFVIRLESYGWLYLDSLAQEELNNGHSDTEKATMSLLTPYAHLTDEDDNASVSSTATTVVVPTKRSPARPSSQILFSKIDKHEPKVVLPFPGRGDVATERRILAMKDDLADEQQKDVFTAILPFLDGMTALEDLAGKLNLKRANVEECVATLERQQHLVTAKVMPPVVFPET